MTSAGRILIMPKGNYDASVTYEMLDLVFHGGASWVAKKTATGIEPSLANAEHWMLMCSGTDITTLEQRMAALEASFVNLANEEDIDLSLYAKQSALDALTVNMQNLGLAVNGLSNEVEGVKSTVSGLSTDVSGIKNTVNGLPSSFAKHQILSYVGVNKFGSESNCCSVTADFPIKLLIYLGCSAVSGGLQNEPEANSESRIFCDELTTTFQQGKGFYTEYNASNTPIRYAKKSADGKTVYWYIGSSSGSSMAQLNAEGYKYYFLALN